MKIRLNEDGTWYHGSNQVFQILKTGSTITPWKELAEAFSHRPSRLSYDDNGTIVHNGTEMGYLYIIDEAVEAETDICQHPGTTMDENAEFLTNRPLKVRLVERVK